MKEKYPKLNKNTHKFSQDQYKKFYEMWKLSISVWAQKRKKRCNFNTFFPTIFRCPLPWAGDGESKTRVKMPGGVRELMFGAQGPSSRIPGSWVGFRPPQEGWARGVCLEGDRDHRRVSSLRVAL